MIFIRFMCMEDTQSAWFNEGKSYWNGWFRGSPIFGNLHICIYIYMCTCMYIYIYVYIYMLRGLGVLVSKCAYEILWNSIPSDAPVSCSRKVEVHITFISLWFMVDISLLIICYKTTFNGAAPSCKHTTKMWKNPPLWKWKTHEVTISMERSIIL